MTFVEFIASDLEYEGMEATVNYWLGGKLTEVKLLWNGEEYEVIK
jgi:hypothetical protein